MKKQAFVITMLLVLVAVSLLSTGCAAPGMTKEQVHRRHVDALDTQMLELQESIDAWLMLDRPPRTTRYYVR